MQENRAIIIAQQPFLRRGFRDARHFGSTHRKYKRSIERESSSSGQTGARGAIPIKNSEIVSSPIARTDHPVPDIGVADREHPPARLTQCTERGECGIGIVGP